MAVFDLFLADSPQGLGRAHLFLRGVDVRDPAGPEERVEVLRVFFQKSAIRGAINRVGLFGIESFAALGLFRRQASDVVFEDFGRGVDFMDGATVVRLETRAIR